MTYLMPHVVLVNVAAPDVVNVVVTKVVEVAVDGRPAVVLKVLKLLGAALPPEEAVPRRLIMRRQHVPVLVRNMVGRLDRFINPRVVEIIVRLFTDGKRLRGACAATGVDVLVAGRVERHSAVPRHVPVAVTEMVLPATCQHCVSATASSGAQDVTCHIVAYLMWQL